MSRRSPLLPLIPLALATLACAISLDTVVRDDESGTLTMTVEISADDLDFFETGEEVDLSDVTCESDDPLPPGASVQREQFGDTVRCIVTTPFNDIAGLRQIYQSLGEGSVIVDCLAFQYDQLIYDVRLISEGSDSVSVEGLVVPWTLTVPGRITSHNADRQEGQTLTWLLDESAGERAMQVNLSEDGACPTDLFLVELLVFEDGTGSATLQAPTLPTGEADTQALIAALRQAGWQVDEPAAGAPSFAARRAWSSEAEFQALAGALPPLAGSQTEFNLALAEDPVTGVQQFDFRGRIDLSGYPAYWQSIHPDLEPPPFRFSYLPPGTLDSTSGNWTDAILLELRWTPGQPPSNTPLRAISVIEPLLEQEVDPEQVDDNLDTIRDRFLDEIPTGQILSDPTIKQRILMGVFSPGLASNMTNWTTWSCGDYQTRVLGWLDGIRTSDDPEIRQQLAGLDYGPVQAYRGGHQAVVVFPRGTDWSETGTVLDPWPNQRPEVFSMEQWTDRFSWGHGVGEGGDRYPQMYGNPSAYPGSNVPSGRLQTRAIGVNSPVAALVTAADGRRVGMLPDGTLVNEIEGADFYPVPKGGDENQWYFGLPEGEYQVTLNGTGEGATHVLVADRDNRLVTYGPQAIGPGAQASLSIGPAGIDQPLVLPSGESVQPIEVTDDNAAELDFGAAGPWAGSQAIAGLPAAGVRAGYLAGLFLCTWGPLAAAWSALVLRRGRRGAGSD